MQPAEKLTSLTKTTLNEKRPFGLGRKVFTVILLLLSVALSALIGIYRTNSLAELAGYSVGSLILLVIVIGLFSISERFRNPDSRWNIAFIYAIVITLSQCLNIAEKVSSVGK